MKKNISIQLKAALLLVVFGLNTLVGFACAVGVDMGFNSPHHQGEVAAKEVHVHSDGKKHEHHKKADKHGHEETKTEKKENDGCCNDDVQKFQQLDKAITQNAKTVIDAPAFVTIISTFLGIDIFNTIQTYPPKCIARYFYPPPPDIRIAIQSFQI